MQAATNNINQEIARQLDEMAEIHSGDRYRKQAYSRAAANIRKYHIPITSGQQAKEAGLGVGDSVKAKIDEILQTGSIQILRNESNPDKLKRETVKLFKKIHGVGKVQAEKWFDAGFRTLQDLLPLYNSGQMTAAQKFGFYYYNDLQLKVPRAEIQIMETALHGIYDRLGLEFAIAGSYRRGLPESGDIDVVVKATDINSVMNPLYSTGTILANLTPDATVKSMLIVRIGNNPARRMDIRLIHPESWPFALLYFTGSKNFNIVIREWALNKGWSLSEYGFSNASTGLLDRETSLKIKTEEDIFTFLGLKYQPPTERTDTVKIIPLVAEEKDLGQWFRPVETVLIFVNKRFLNLAATGIAKKIAGFDLDHTITQHKSGKTFSKDLLDLEVMPNRIPILKSLIDQGYMIIIFSNQKSLTDGKRQSTFAKLQQAVSFLDMPLMLMAALGDDNYRKPHSGMWELANQYLRSVDWASSFYCGDAAGRQGDFAASDLEFAKNRGIKFFTPEEIFRPL